MRTDTQMRSRERGLVPGFMADKVLMKASSHHVAGRLEDAERLYLRVLKTDPHHAGANYKLGVIASERGDTDAAVRYLTTALKADPQQPRYWLSLAMALLGADRLPDARTILEKFVALDFACPELDPVKKSLVDALFSDACGHYHAGRFTEAEAFCDTLVVLDPTHAEALHVVSNIALQTGRVQLASDVIEIALSLDDSISNYHGCLGNVRDLQGRVEEAIASHQKSLELKPREALTHSNLGGALHKGRRLREAVHHYREALKLDPGYASAHSNLGNVLKDLGRHDEAISCYDTALRLKPDLPFVHSNRLFAKMYSEDASPLEQLADAQSFGRYFADPLLRRRPFPNVLDVARKLRIGFVSGDFFEHAVNHFFEPVIKNFDAERFETFAYSNTIKEDAVTERLKPLFTHWRSILGISDDAAADLIEADQIDILVDLSGHTAGNRLLVFARKPAPIQVSWIGYPGTTGMAAIDYRLTDHVTEPEGLTEHLNTEILWRLPRMAACYQPSALTIPVMNHPPSDDNGYVTFGCINRFAKVTDSVLAVWAQILARVPTARLLLEVGDIENPEFRAETEARFERLGLPLDRVILEPRRAAYMLFHRMDVALDPFPFNGVTTSMDTLWMGVPFVALAGTHLISRLGSAILTTAGLPELVAQTPDEYVEVAARLARDADWLRTVRHDLRDRLTRSPLMDHKGLADEVGVAFRGMWTGWVTRASLECAS